MSGPGSSAPSDDAIWASMSATLREVVLPQLSDAWSRAVTVQLIALADHARGRGPDPVDGRRAEIAAALDRLSENPLVSGHWPGEPYDAAGAALAEAVGRDDPAAAAVRAELRPLLVGHLDEDLAMTLPLLDAFRGRLRDG